MKKATIIFLLLLIGCTNNPNKIEDLPKKNSLKKNLTFEVFDEIHISDLFENQIENRNLIDTSSLGQQELEFNGEKITYNIVDTTKPVINLSNLTTYVGQKINFLDSIMCGDNYDRELRCEIVGEYDFNKVGTYLLKVVATDSSGNTDEKEFKLIVTEKKSSSGSNNPTYYYFKDLISKYKTEKTMVGIDVSVWQGNIDFKKVKDAGCEFVMIRIGFGPKNNEMIFDSKFKDNLKKAKDAGLKVGLYFYSYAKNIDDAEKQANWIIKSLNGEKLDLPIAFDWEIWNGFNNYKINFKDLNDVADAFINKIDEAGYSGVIYSSAFYLNRVWKPNKNPWLAYYTNNNDFEKPYFMWQLSSRGNIDGINGYVDLNVLYLDKKN